MKKQKNLYRLVSFILVQCLMITGLFMFSSCEKDEDKQDSLVGTYVFTSAILTEDLVYQTQTIMPAGTNVSTVVRTGLLGSAPCSNPSNAAVELKKNKELYFVCLTEANEEKAGTWDVNSERTILTLNLSAPPLPAALSLEVIDFVEGTTSFTGSIENLPITGDLIPGGLLPPTVILLMSFDVQFSKVL